MSDLYKMFYKQFYLNSPYLDSYEEICTESHKYKAMKV